MTILVNTVVFEPNTVVFWANIVFFWVNTVVLEGKYSSILGPIQWYLGEITVVFRGNYSGIWWKYSPIWTKYSGIWS